MQRAYVVCFAFCAGIFFSPGSFGLSLRRPQWSELLQQAERIVLAQVRDQKSLTLTNGIPLTQTRFDVLKTYRGTAESTLSLTLLGGRTPQIQIKLPSIPTFQAKTTVLLLLRQSQYTKQWLLVALYYGIFDVTTQKGQTWASHRGRLIPNMLLSALESQLNPISTPLRKPTPRRKASGKSEKRLDIRWDLHNLQKRR